MRILGHVPNYPPASMVGAWLGTHRCLTHLAAVGHTVEVLTHKPVAPYRLDGVDVLGPVDLYAAAAAADVIISHLGDKGDAARAAVKLRKPSVRMVHSAVGPCRTMLGRWPTALAVYNSQATADVIRWKGRGIVCHPPVFVDEWATVPGDRVTLVNLSHNKGGDLFWRIARNALQHRFLAVVGCYGVQLVERGHLNVDVIPTTTNMRDDVYARTRILLMPSETEAWGMTAIEAMCSGIPVIAHPTPGLVESLGDAGVFVDRNNPDGWLEAIDRLTEPTEWELWSKRAKARVAELDPAADLARFTREIERTVATW